MEPDVEIVAMVCFVPAVNPAGVQPEAGTGIREPSVCWSTYQTTPSLEPPPVDQYSHTLTSAHDGGMSTVTDADSAAAGSKSIFGMPTGDTLMLGVPPFGDKDAVDPRRLYAGPGQRNCRIKHTACLLEPQRHAGCCGVNPVPVESFMYATRCPPR